MVQNFCTSKNLGAKKCEIENLEKTILTKTFQDKIVKEAKMLKTKNRTHT